MLGRSFVLPLLLLLFAVVAPFTPRRPQAKSAVPSSTREGSPCLV